MKVFIVTQKCIDYDEHQLPTNQQEYLIDVFRDDKEALEATCERLHFTIRRAKYKSIIDHSTWDQWVIHDLCSDKADSGYYRSVYIKITTVEIN